MAQKQPEAEAAPPEEGQKKSKLKLLVIAGIATLIVAGGGTTAYVMTRKHGGETGDAKATPKKMPVFVDLDTFTVNLPGDDADRFMQIKLVAEVRDAASGEMIRTLMPAVRNEILLLLGSKRAAEVATREGKQKLAAEIVVAANKPLDGTAAANGVEGVNFTHLIVQ
jgi:flagellar FliL protein